MDPSIFFYLFYAGKLFAQGAIYLTWLKDIASPSSNPSHLIPYLGPVVLLLTMAPVIHLVIHILHSIPLSTTFYIAYLCLNVPLDILWFKPTRQAKRTIYFSMVLAADSCIIIVYAINIYRYNKIDKENDSHIDHSIPPTLNQQAKPLLRNGSFDEADYDSNWNAVTRLPQSPFFVTHEMTGYKKGIAEGTEIVKPARQHSDPNSAGGFRVASTKRSAVSESPYPTRGVFDGRESRSSLALQAVRNAKAGEFHLSGKRRKWDISHLGPHPHKNVHPLVQQLGFSGSSTDVTAEEEGLPKWNE